MEKKHRIAMVAACPFPVSQGSQVFIKQMSEALTRRGHQVHLVCYHFGEYHEASSFAIHRIPRVTSYSRFRAGPSFQKPFLDLMLTLKLWQVVKRESIEIIHAHNYEAPLAGFLVRSVTGIPVIFNSHNVLSDELYTYFHSTLSKRVARSVAHYLDHYIPQKADFCITVSEESVNFLRSKGVASENIAYIPPGIDYHNNLNYDGEGLRRKYNLKLHPLIIYTGNLDGYQNIPLLLHSLKRVADSIPAFTMLIITNSDHSGYQKIAEEMGIGQHVRFLSQLPFKHIQELLTLSDIAVSPRTSWSGFPIKLLNYMAAGKAIVASEGSAKSIEHLKNGIVIKNGDLEGFAEGIINLIKNPQLAQRLGENAKKTASRYTWDKIVQEIEEVYEHILQHPPRR